jgi:hypothetical protein
MIWPECRTIVPIASQNGTTNTRRIDIVMTVTASPRPFHNLACTFRNIGQIAIASIAAHSMAGRNGRRIHTLPAIKAAMKRMANVVRVRSLRTSTMDSYLLLAVAPLC